MATIKLNNLKQVQRALSSKAWDKAIKRNMGFANGRISKKIKTAIADEIRRGVPPKNAPLTLALKKGTSPLKDKGDLIKAIETKHPEWDHAFAGFVSTNKLFQVALLLHEGAALRVTNRMRTMFYYLWLKSMGRDVELRGRARELFDLYKEWKPIADSTQSIVIPPRKFLESAFNSPKVQKIFEEEWEAGAIKVLKEVVKK